MKKIKIFKTFMTCLIAFLVSLSAIPNNVLANDDDEIFMGRPLIRVASTQTVEAAVGTTTAIRIRIQNAGSAEAQNLFIQASAPADSPFSVSVRQINIAALDVRGARDVVIEIAADSNAEIGTYPFALNFVYSDATGTIHENSETMQVRIVTPNVVPDVSLRDFELSPGSLRPGSTAVLSATYENRSAARARDVRVSLEGLSNEGVTVVGGLSSVSITEAGAGNFSERISFTVTAASNVRSGSYPVTFVTTYTDEWGNNHRNETVFFVNVSTGNILTGESSITVTNIRSAPGTYTVGQNFTIGFDLLNEGTGSASSIRVTANAVEDRAIVPTSQNIQIIRTLAPGERSPVSFTFAATSNAATRNYPIEITIEYFDGEVNDPDLDRISFSHYFGVNISNPDDDDDDDDRERNLPKIIISDYYSNPTIVTAGETFDLSMTFFNSHPTRPISNIRITLTAQERDQERGANIFSPVNASNTLHIMDIPPNGTATRTIRFFTVPDAQPQNYTISVNFEYEDDRGNRLRSEELIGINVSQPPRIETSPIEIPPVGSVGQPVFVNFDMYNTGRVNIHNLRVIIDGNFHVDGNRSMWFGNFEQGDFESYQIMFFPTDSGTLTGTITIEYECATGEQLSIPHEFTMEIMDMEPMDMFPGDGFDRFPPDFHMNGEGGIPTWVYIAGGAAAVIAAGAVIVVFVIRKRKKEFEFDE